MMIQNYFTFLFYLLLSIQVHQVSSFRELDDANSRHPVGQPSYDVDNPPPTAKPSMVPSMQPSLRPSSFPSSYPSLIPTLLPTKTPSMTPSSIPSLSPSTHPSTHPSTSPSHQPSIYTCKTNANGEFGNTTGVAKERVSFRYELILNTGELNTHPDNYTNVTKTTILPLIENGMMDLLFPYIFTECIDENSNSTNTTSFANIQGISRVPEDIIVIAACNGETSGNNTCFPVDAEFSIYFRTRRRLAEDRQEMKQMKQIIQTAMMENQLISAHPAIVGMAYIETDANPIVNPPNGQEGLERIQGNDQTLWWKIVLGIGGVGLFVALAMLLWRKRKDRDEDDFSDLSIESSYAENELS